ncbi:OmpA family protein [uncultured Hymenobacter sp.]|uniref:OmpA family protein n=1 Tax=uncultured Hymenobacter sp. TaxID=170016 RepID=UPI0035CB8837
MTLLRTLLLTGWLLLPAGPKPPLWPDHPPTRRRPPASSGSALAAPPARPAAGPRCDGKLYGIAAERYYQGHWEDDCRTLHEFTGADLSARPVVHRRVLPFQSYALAKGFDNCLYAVTNAPSNAPELVYRYDPATRTGRYTAWLLPPQGPETNWISAATDEQGDLYFGTSDGAKLVKVCPADGQVSVVWEADPLRQAPYYPEIGFSAAGTHGNFCLDDATTVYFVYSTDGSLLKVDRLSQRPAPERVQLTGLPARGGYSDVLLQNDAAGRRRLYLAGPKALYEVNMARRQARRVRQGTYTDLAGCNLFSAPASAPAAPSSPPPAPLLAAGAVWRGQVLDARTGQPLPDAQLRVEGGVGAATAVPLSAQGRFAYAGQAGRAYPYHAERPGYLPADSVWTAAPGAGPAGPDVRLRPLAVGTTVALEQVRFDRGQADLRPESAAALDQLVGLLRANPRLMIELRGHTDNVGSAAENMALSERRVAAVRAYLLGQGVAEARVSGVGFGGSQPIASNAQEATRRRNRRVEFRVTSLQ